jgi:aminoglycoside phosphotransferase (APT) family kinase protein
LTAEQRHEGEIPMDEARVRALLRAQFPQWADLPLVELAEQGTDHTLYRLGDTMVVRMPIRPFAGAPLAKQQAGREAAWVPYLASRLPLELPIPVGLGEPTDDYPWHWSIVSWIDGVCTDADNTDMDRALDDLAAFIRALHAIDTTGAPTASSVNWGRGQSLRPGAQMIRDAIDRVSDRYDTAPMRAAWDAAIEADEWDRPGVWFHGDLQFGNLISRDGRLVGVIDSPYGVGDPACDLMPGWTMFRGKERARFFEAVGLDEATKIRSRGWVLGPACYGLTYYRNVPSLLAKMLAAVECALSD